MGRLDLPDVTRDEPYDVALAGAPIYLSGRELEVLEHLAMGRTNQTIAAFLGIKLETVKSHVVHILGELGARNRAHAVAIGMRRRLIR